MFGCAVFQDVKASKIKKNFLKAAKILTGMLRSLSSATSTTSEQLIEGQSVTPSVALNMFHPTPSLFGNLRRLALTTKNGPKDYYKGNRTGAMGRHDKRGGYIVEYERVRTYVFPKNIDECKVRDSV
jgi:hypothetical protein